MKANFVVSANFDAWIPQARKLFAADPYIVHVLEKNGRLAAYGEVEIAQARRETRESFQLDHDFVDQKFHRHMEILVRRLKQLHGDRFGEQFWSKALSLALLRHVSMCYDLFQVCEHNLNPELHDCRVLDTSCYVIPVDFDDHRRLFQSTDFGQEQLFSIYCELFHPGQFAAWRGNLQVDDYEQEPSSVKPRARWKRISLKSIARRFARLRNPKMGIMNAYFSSENMDRLFLRSGGSIQVIPLPELPPSTTPPQWTARTNLSSFELDFDRFDKFAFAALRTGMPKLFVEDFSQVLDSLNTYFEKYNNLRWIVCEGWIGHTLSSLALAVLKLRGVRHIYNEHNYIAHPFLGNNLKYITPLVDEFDSLGWKDSSVPNLVSGASLFRWIEGAGAGAAKKHDLLFISSIPNTRAPEINSCYGESGDRVVPGYLEMNKRFFKALPDSTLASMLYRAYPAKYSRHALAWDQGFVLQDYLSKVKAVDDSTTPARILMQSSRLTVINYLSTSYLEALLANVPTIILWNQAAYFLEDRYAGFFDGLVAAKICHTDPVAAAKFVEQILNDPESWWWSGPVQQARTAFLEKNMGVPEVQVKLLFERARHGFRQ